MEFSITPYQGESPMKLWPTLAEYAYCLKGKNETIFYYDAPPAGKASGTSSPSPVLILVHGLGDEADSWRHLIPLVTSLGYRAIALDLPGFGRSAARGRISFKTHVKAVLKVLEAVVAGINDEAPVFLVGNSMGAFVAEAAALQKPVCVRGFVLLDGTLPGGPSNPGLIVLAKMLFSRKWYRAYRDDEKGAWITLYPYYADLDAMSQEDKDFLNGRVLARVRSPTQERAFFSVQRSLIWVFITSQGHFARKIRNYKGKILLLWGEKDRILPLSTANRFKSLKPDIEPRLIGGAGHLPQQEKPEEVARLIVRFVEAGV